MVFISWVTNQGPTYSQRSEQKRSSYNHFLLSYSSEGFFGQFFQLPTSLLLPLEFWMTGFLNLQPSALGWLVGDYKSTYKHVCSMQSSLRRPTYCSTLEPYHIAAWNVCETPRQWEALWEQSSAFFPSVSIASQDQVSVTSWYGNLAARTV